MEILFILEKIATNYTNYNWGFFFQFVEFVAKSNSRIFAFSKSFNLN